MSLHGGCACGRHGRRLTGPTRPGEIQRVRMPCGRRLMHACGVMQTRLGAAPGAAGRFAPEARVAAWGLKPPPGRRAWSGCMAATTEHSRSTRPTVSAAPGSPAAATARPSSPASPELKGSPAAAPKQPAAASASLGSRAWPASSRAACNIPAAGSAAAAARAQLVSHAVSPPESSSCSRPVHGAPAAAAPPPAPLLARAAQPLACADWGGAPHARSGGPSRRGSLGTPRTEAPRASPSSPSSSLLAGDAPRSWPRAACSHLHGRTRRRPA